MRRQGKEPVTYDHPSLEPVLKETLGVILYQEQVIQAAMAIAGFTAGQADQMRRAMTRKRSREAMAAMWEEFCQGALASGVDEATARRVFEQGHGLRRVRLPEEPRRRLRPAGLPVGLAQEVLPAGVHLRPPQRPAHGLLPAGGHRGRRPPPRRRRPAARREPEPPALHRRRSEQRARRCASGWPTWTASARRAARPSSPPATAAGRSARCATSAGAPASGGRRSRT